MDRRKFKRVPLHDQAILHYQGSTLEGEVQNLSPKGAFIGAQGDFRLNDIVTVTLHFARLAPTTILATIVRLTKEGIGLMFQFNDIESFIALKNSLPVSVKPPFE